MKTEFHPASEIPSKKNTGLVMYNDEGLFYAISYRDDESFKFTVEQNKAAYWCYEDELLAEIRERCEDCIPLDDSQWKSASNVFRHKTCKSLYKTPDGRIGRLDAYYCDLADYRAHSVSIAMTNSDSNPLVFECDAKGNTTGRFFTRCFIKNKSEYYTLPRQVRLPAVGVFYQEGKEPAYLVKKDDLKKLEKLYELVWNRYGEGV